MNERRRESASAKGGRGRGRRARGRRGGEEGGWEGWMDRWKKGRREQEASSNNSTNSFTTLNPCVFYTRVELTNTCIAGSTKRRICHVGILSKKIKIKKKICVKGGFAM